MLDYAKDCSVRIKNARGPALFELRKLCAGLIDIRIGDGQPTMEEIGLKIVPMFESLAGTQWRVTISTIDTSSDASAKCNYNVDEPRDRLGLLAHLAREVRLRRATRALRSFHSISTL